MSVVAPVTVAWQRVRDFALDPDDNKKRIETFSTLDTAISRAREVIRKAENPNDGDYGGSNSQAHITLHPGNYDYGTTLSQNDLEDVFITILPGAFTQQGTLNLPQNSQDNVADLKLIGTEGGGTGTFDDPVLEFDLGGTTVEGGIQVRDGNTVSQLLYDTVDEEWLIGDDTVIEGDLTVEQSLNVPNGITGDILPSGVPAESVTFIDETSGQISGQTVFSYDESEELLSVPNIELENGTAVSEIKTTADGDSDDALVTEGALDEAKLDVTGGGGTTVSGIDELTFDGIGGVGASILDDGDGTATLEISTQQLNPANFVSTSGDTMDGTLTLDAGLRFTSGTQFTVTEISDTVSQNPDNSTLVTESAVRTAVDSVTVSAGSGIDIDSSFTVSHSNTGGAINDNDADTFINTMTFDGFGHVEAISSTEVPTSISAGSGISVNQSTGDVTVSVSGDTLTTADVTQNVAPVFESVMAGSEDPNADNGFFRRFDEFGNEAYSKDITPGEVSSIASVGQFIFIGESDVGTRTAIYKRDFDSGDQLDELILGTNGPAPVEMEPAENEDAFYVALNNNEVRKYDTDFVELWSITPSDWMPPSSEGSAISVQNGNVYLAGDSLSSGSLYNELVRLDDQGSIVTETYAVDLVSPEGNGFVAVEVGPSEQFVFATDQENQLRKIDAQTGTQISSVQIRPTATGRRGRDLVFDIDGNLIVAHGEEGVDGLITKYDVDLNQLQRQQVFTEPVNEIDVDEAGNVYAGSDTGEVKSFDSSFTERWTNTNFQTTPDVEVRALEFVAVRVTSDDKIPSETGVFELIDDVRNEILERGAGFEALDDGNSVATGVSEVDFQDSLTVSSVSPTRVAIDVAGGVLGPTDVLSGDAIKVTQEPNDQISIDFAGNIQQSVFDGNGSKLEFVIPHGLSSTPESWLVQAATDDASSLSHVAADATNLYVRYDTPPPTGSGNVILNWLAKES